ncbi:GNAT family N-acetyltransferase [Porphyromonas sp.]
MINLTYKGSEGRVSLSENDKELGYLTFRLLPKQAIAIAEHTVVDPAHQGKGIAGRLAAAFFEHCREQQLLVHPTCSYIVAYMQRHPELSLLMSSADKDL